MWVTVCGCVGIWVYVWVYDNEGDQSRVYTDDTGGRRIATLTEFPRKCQLGLYGDDDERRLDWCKKHITHHIVHTTPLIILRLCIHPPPVWR